jgi:hypothetical protein
MAVEQTPHAEAATLAGPRTREKGSMLPSKRGAVVEMISFEIAGMRVRRRSREMGRRSVGTATDILSTGGSGVWIKDGVSGTIVTS